MRRIEKGLIAAILLLTVTTSAFAAVESAYGCEYPPPCPCPPGTVLYLGKDTVTKGDWMNATGSPIGVSCGSPPRYGSYAHILPNAPHSGQETPAGSFSVPVGNFTYAEYGWTPNQIGGLPFHKPLPTYWDEYVSLSPTINYSLTGTLYNMSGIGPIQYPVFEWAWDDFNSSDPRAAHFQTNVPGAGGPGTRMTCWDCGAERPLGPSDGNFSVTLAFPDGLFMLSLYAYDKSFAGRPNQTIQITDETGKILASAVIEQPEFTNSIYLQFIVCGPTTIIVQVIKGPKSVNAVLSGIFVDKLKCISRGEGTIGFWKTNLAKLLCYLRGSPQVSRLQMMQCIAFAKNRCPAVFGSLTSLSSAYLVFSHYSDSMLSKAKAQLLALLFNVASRRAYEGDIVRPYLVHSLGSKYPLIGPSDYPLTLKDTIEMTCDCIQTGNNLEFAKDLCETLNQGYQTIARY